MHPASETNRWWWALAIAGVVSILFGLAALLWPGLTLAVFIYLFGIYAIVFGITELIHMFRTSEAHSLWWTHMLVGAISILAGLAALFWPGQTTVALLYIIAIWAVSVGVVEIAGAFLLNQLYLAISGMISVLFGFLLFANPGAGALALVIVIGVFAIVRGIMLLIAAVSGPTTHAVS